MVKKFNADEFDREDDEEGGATGQTGTGAGGIEFKTDLFAGEPRDDFLSSLNPEQLKNFSPRELERLLKAHGEKHYDLVKQQKIERKNRNDLKEGKRPAIGNNYGNTGFGYNRGFKQHPISAKAYFSGIIDKQVTINVSQSDIQTNQDKQNELDLRYDLRNDKKHRLEHGYRYQPPQLKRY